MIYVDRFGENKRKNPMRILESGLLTTGVVLLATFLLIRGWGDYQSWSDVHAFELAVASGSNSPIQSAGNAATRYYPEL